MDLRRGRDVMKTDDVKGARPKILHRPTNKEDKALNTQDVDGAKPRAQEFNSNRKTNPVDPQYVL